MLFEIDGDGACLALDCKAPSGPDACYTTFRTYGGQRMLLLERHHARLVESAALQGRTGALSELRLRRGLAAALAACDYRESRVRVTFSPPRLWVLVEAFEPLPAALYTHGVACACVPVRRANPQAKDAAFLDVAQHARATLPAGVHEGLMVAASDDALLEGLSSNFFAVLRGELRTEPRRVLGGVTRGLVLELARPLVTLRLEPVRRAELAEVSEAFLTSVSRGVLPVTRIDDLTLGAGRPGPVTRALSLAFEDLAAREAVPALG
jgi:branched-subunit amino acid aminotransferase/4-amino-4-deoxychorismate lyase